MAMVTAFIPKKYDQPTKQRLIAALGDVECLGFEMSRDFEHVYLHEFDVTHSDEMLQKTKYLVIYTGANKSTAAKERLVRLFREKCDEIFGPEDTLYASVIIEEHPNWLISCEGEMRCEDPIAIARQKEYAEKE